MAISARSAEFLPRADSSGLVDMRVGSQALGGTYLYEGDDLVTPWHHHDLHEILYAIRGSIEVETDSGQYLLPPRQAAWIPARVRHKTTIRSTVRNISVLLHPSLVPDPGSRARVLGVSPVIKEMMAFAERWPIGRTSSEQLADQFFEVFARLVGTALDDEVPLSLPTSNHPVVSAAMAFTNEGLEDVNVRQVAAAVNVSERTLRRLFDAQTGMSWRQYVLHARLLRAMALLAEPDASVMHVSTAVGFESVSAFTRAFARHLGETPAVYRRRMGPVPNTLDRDRRKGVRHD